MPATDTCTPARASRPPPPPPPGPGFPPPTRPCGTSTRPRQGVLGPTRRHQEARGHLGPGSPGVRLAVRARHGFAKSKSKPQIGGGGFRTKSIRCGKFRGALWILCGAPRQSPQCVVPVCEKFAENLECRVGNFAVNLNREISHAKLKCHEIPPCGELKQQGAAAPSNVRVKFKFSAKCFFLACTWVRSAMTHGNDILSVCAEDARSSSPVLTCIGLNA